MHPSVLVQIIARILLGPGVDSSETKSALLKAGFSRDSEEFLALSVANIARLVGSGKYGGICPLPLSERFSAETASLRVGGERRATRACLDRYIRLGAY